MKYYFPIHFNGGNRGCEGIAKGTAILLGEEKNNLIGLCDDIELDHKLGIDKYVKLEKKAVPSYFKRALRLLKKIIGKTVDSIDPYTNFIKKMNNEDIMISSGGDMMCYSNNQVISTNNYAHKKGIKTILWGCSMGPENLTPEKEETLKKFSLIYARESLTYNFFKSLNLPNIVCYPDPAFILEAEKVDLPEYLRKDKYVGINISNFTIGDKDKLETPMGEEIIDLITYIIDNTEYNILLIPHVLWPERGQDDRILSQKIKIYFKDSNRIHVLNSEDYNYLQIRYIISKCTLFIGARTHAMISAYSTYIPSMALGYSIKSHGIAKDLGLPEELVFNTKKFKSGDLIKAFKFLDSHKNEIANNLRNIIPIYKNKTFKIREHLENLKNSNL